MNSIHKKTIKRLAKVGLRSGETSDSIIDYLFKVMNKEVSLKKISKVVNKVYSTSLVFPEKDIKETITIHNVKKGAELFIGSIIKDIIHTDVVLNDGTTNILVTKGSTTQDTMDMLSDKLFAFGVGVLLNGCDKHTEDSVVDEGPKDLNVMVFSKHDPIIEEDFSNYLSEFGDNVDHVVYTYGREADLSVIVEGIVLYDDVGDKEKYALADAIIKSGTEILNRLRKNAIGYADVNLTIFTESAFNYGSIGSMETATIVIDALKSNGVTVQMIVENPKVDVKETFMIDQENILVTNNLIENVTSESCEEECEECDCDTESDYSVVFDKLITSLNTGKFN